MADLMNTELTPEQKQERARIFRRQISLYFHLILLGLVLVMLVLAYVAGLLAGGGSFGSGFVLVALLVVFALWLFGEWRRPWT
jgi:hypothetical protein